MSAGNSRSQSGKAHIIAFSSPGAKTSGYCASTGVRLPKRTEANGKRAAISRMRAAQPRSRNSWSWAMNTVIGFDGSLVFSNEYTATASRVSPRASELMNTCLRLTMTEDIIAKFSFVCPGNLNGM